MPKRRVNRYRFTPARKAAIRKAQAASAAKRRKKSYSAPNVRAGVFPKTKAQRNEYYRNSGMSMPGSKKVAPIYTSSQTAGRVRYGNINTYYYPGSAKY